MKTIKLPEGCKFVPFDGYGGVGFLVAAAEFPSENQLTERMRHDWELGVGLLTAMRQGRLRVRHCRTKLPMKPDASSVEVLTALVSVEDLRTFVEELGYDVQVMPNSVPQALAVREVQGEPAEPGIGADAAPAPKPRLLKKSALIQELQTEWRSIEKDIGDMGRNGLRIAAYQEQQGKHGRYDVDAAKAWAKTNDRLRTEDMKPMCRIPYDCIDSRRYPLFMARAAMRELVQDLTQATGELP